jgi:Tol biopolymer transport system component
MMVVALFASCTLSFTGCSGDEDPKMEKILFGSDRDGTPKLYLMNPDGTDQVLVTQDGYVAGEPALAVDGRIAFSRSGYIYSSDITGGDVVQLTSDSKYEHCARWSPDGSQILFTSGMGTDAEIYLMSRDGSGLTNITNSPAYDGFPAWSPDGSRLFFKGTRDATTGLFIMNLDGSGLINLTSDGGEGSGDWAPDGARIVFSMSPGPGDRQIHVINVDGSGLRVLDHPGDCFAPVWSPSNRRIAFTRNLAEERDVVVINADGSGAIVLTAAGHNDSDPDWERIRAVSAVVGGQITGPGG